MNSPRHPLSALVLCGLLLLIPNAPVQAGNATWNLNPVSNNWNTAANWTPADVPDGEGETPVFALSNTTNVVVNTKVDIEEIIFDLEASAYRIPINSFANLAFWTVGITNNSGQVQNFATAAKTHVRWGGHITFLNDSTAGSQTVFTNQGGTSRLVTGRAGIDFDDSSTAGDAVFVNQGAVDDTYYGGGYVDFRGDSSAGNAVFINEGGAGRGGAGGMMTFTDNATAGNASFTLDGGAVGGAFGSQVNFGGNANVGTATFVVNGGQAQGAHGGLLLLLAFNSAQNGIFTVNGGVARSASGGSILFGFRADAADGTYIINGGTRGGPGGRLSLAEDATGGRARVELFGNGSLDLSFHAAPGITIGSLEGDGLVLLGNNNLTIGSNNLTTEFSGNIQNNGSLSKVGMGVFTLNGTNTYTGATTLSAGILVINNTTGSGTGTGAVEVDAGTLAGSGIIAGTVKVGTGSGTGAFLAPGMGASKAITLTIQSAVTFKADSTCTCRLNTKKTKADQVVANGVTIESGAQFNFKVTGNKKLRIGKSATVISNTAANPISGTFSNLPDGSTFTVGPNTFQVSYSGGDGNDLTLTVVP